jgi:hypothetical protein
MSGDADTPFVTSASALAAIKEAVAAGHWRIGTGDSVFSLITTFDVEEAADNATKCEAQGRDWVVASENARFVFRIDAEDVVLVGYQALE